MDTRRILGWQCADDILHALRKPRINHIGDFLGGIGGTSADSDASGLNYICLDVMLDSENHNLGTSLGFATWVTACLSIVTFGFALMGFPCSSFVWLARGHTCKEEQQQSPRGHEQRRRKAVQPSSCKDYLSMSSLDDTHGLLAH